jgi:D-alanyl-D-alanine carboxypeptidase
MPRVVTAAFCLVLLAAPQCALAQLTDSPEGCTCRAFIVYDLSAERTVALCNPYQKQPIASLTKLMTAVLAVEHLRFDGRYVLTPDEQKTFKVETMRADKMLELMLIPSNNAVCRIVARLVSGSEEQFAELMNRRAAELSLKDTLFANASGLPADGQHSTLFDVLALSRVALTYPRIRQAMSQPDVELGGIWYKGTLRDLYERHPALQCGKTGYTRAAGRCLVLNYAAGGHEYIVITLGSKSVAHSFRDAELILADLQLYDGQVGNWGIEGLEQR